MGIGGAARWPIGAGGLDWVRAGWPRREWLGPSAFVLGQLVRQATTAFPPASRVSISELLCAGIHFCLIERDLNYEWPVTPETLAEHDRVEEGQTGDKRDVGRTKDIR